MPISRAQELDPDEGRGPMCLTGAIKLSAICG
jgi:hypothetical protein